MPIINDSQYREAIRQWNVTVNSATQALLCGDPQWARAESRKAKDLENALLNYERKTA